MDHSYRGGDVKGVRCLLLLKMTRDRKGQIVVVVMETMTRKDKFGVHHKWKMDYAGI